MTGVRAILGLLILGFIAAPSSAQTRPATAPDAPICARWDVLLNQSGLEAITDLGVPVIPTKSKIYQAMVCDADMLRGAVAQAAATNGLEGASQSVGFLTPLIHRSEDSFFLEYIQTPQSHVVLYGSAVGHQNMTAVAAGKMQLTLDFPSCPVRLVDLPRLRTAVDNSAPAAIEFDNTLAPGQAVAFLRTFNSKSGIPFYHLIVWEVFNVESWQLAYFQCISDSGWWAQNGPENTRAAANASVVWCAQAAPSSDKVPPGFEKTLSDGKVLRIMGLCRPDKWPFCWWDGAGQPTSLQIWESINWWSLGSIQCYLSVSAGPDEWALVNPSGKPDPNIGEPHFPFLQSGLQRAEKSAELNVGVPVGKWEQLGQVDLGKSITIDGVVYNARRAGKSPTQFFLQFYPPYQQGPGDLMAVSAIMKDGSEVFPRDLLFLVDSTYGGGQMAFDGKPANVQTLHVWRRKRQWVTFDHLPQEPAVAPREDVTAQEVTAAQKKIQMH